MTDTPAETATAATLPQAKAKQRRKRIVLLSGLAVLFIALGLAYGAYWLLVARYRVVTDDAYVQGNRVILMAQTQGVVAAVNADGTDLVREGQELVIIDPTDARTALEQAEAALAGAVRQVRTLHQQAEQQQAVIAGQKATLAQAESDFRRNKDLVARKTISQQVFQDSQTALETARAGLDQAEHQLAVLRIEIGDTDIPHHPAVVQAVAVMRAAWLALKRTDVVAPVTGFVANRQVQIGQNVTPGTPLMAVVPLEQVWVEANFKETELAGMRIGQKASLTADLYGKGVVYHGEVEGISAGTGSVFQLLPPQNATGNWIKVVQRVPVRIRLDSDDLTAHPLRLGLSTVVTVDTGDRSGEVLAQKPVEGARYHTDVYADQETGFQQAAARIIAANGGDLGVNDTWPAAQGEAQPAAQADTQPAPGADAGAAPQAGEPTEARPAARTATPAGAQVLPAEMQTGEQTGMQAEAQAGDGR